MVEAAGGKLRGAILAGFNSDAIMAAVRTVTFICDAWMWPTLVAVKVDDGRHIMIVLPVVWTESLRWLRLAANEPEAVIDSSTRLDAVNPTLRAYHNRVRGLAFKDRGVSMKHEAAARGQRQSQGATARGQAGQGALGPGDGANPKSEMRCA